MLGKPILVVIPTRAEFESFRERAESYTNPFAHLVHVPTKGTTSGSIRLRVDNNRHRSWIHLFIVCPAGQGMEVKETLRDFIDDIKPHLVVLGGIAGGIVNHDVGIGDIVFSDVFYSPLYKKATPKGEKAPLLQTKGEVAGWLAKSPLFKELSGRLTKYVQSNHVKPSEADIEEAIKNQGLSGDNFDRALTLTKKHFTRLFDKSKQGGIIVDRFEAYSEPINQQALYTAFLKYSELNPELGIAEMEAQILYEVMRDLGRKDKPLIVKCISDVPGLARSEPIKVMCRELAAEALFGLFENQNFALALEKRDRYSGGNRVARNSFTRASGAPHLFGIANEETLIQLMENPELFREDDISNLASQISNDEDLAAAMVDVWVHFASVCPRCGRGAAQLSRLKPVFQATLHSIVGQQKEIVRAGQLAGVAPLYGIRTDSIEKLDWESLARGLRGSTGQETKKSALMGRIYNLMSRDLRATVSFIERLQRTGEFHDQSFAVWFYTAVAAAVSRGVRIDEIKHHYFRKWEPYLSLYNDRYPFSYDITTLIPILTGQSHLDEISDASEKLDQFKFAIEGKPEQNPIGQHGKIIVISILDKAGQQEILWDEEILSDVEGLTKLNYVPLLPVNAVLSHLHVRGILNA